MDQALTELCDYLNNYFWTEKRAGKVTISGGTFTASYLQDGQYFRIVGSVFNDGVHQYPVSDLHDETFDGAIWPMAVPEKVIGLASEIAEWQSKYGGVDSNAMSPYASESFNNYSYSKDTGASGSSASATPNSWQSAYASRLQKWRRLRGAS